VSPLTQFTAAGAASSHGLSSSAVNIVIGLLVLAWIIYGQLRRKPLGAARPGSGSSWPLPPVATRRISI
jgi:hypothetical protein